MVNKDVAKLIFYLGQNIRTEEPDRKLSMSNLYRRKANTVQRHSNNIKQSIKKLCVCYILYFEQLDLLKSFL